MPQDPKQGFSTIAVHAGQTGESSTLSRGVPVYRTASYLFRDSQHASSLFSLKESGNIYTRLMNPTTDVLEKRMAALEEGVGALAFASGTNAIFSTIINMLESGDEVLSAGNLYGGTFTMFNNILPQFGLKARFFDYDDPESAEKLINARTRVIHIETVGNPMLGIPDFEKIAAVANKFHVPLVVDSTFTTPYLFKPLLHGADIVVHSLTKWIGGHGAALGGVVVDGGTFDWTDPKFRLFNEPDSSYNGLRFAHDLGELQQAAFIVRLRLAPLRNLGGCISPDNSWLFIQGLETLALRMERHCSNALCVAEFLKKHPRTEWLRYPGLSSDSSYLMAKKFFRNAMGGGVVVFGLKGGPAEAERFISRLQLFSHVANVGDAKSLAIHPASTTHSQLSSEEQSSSGLPPDLVRLSIGIEDVDDILRDLEQALAGAD